MTFVDLLKRIERYIRLDSPEIRYVLKDFVNDAIVDFIRIWDWQYLIKSAPFTTDGSDSYNIATIIGDDPFYGAIEMFRPGISDTGKSFKKVTYSEYVKALDKSSIWATSGGLLYREGTGEDLIFFFLTPGDPYPLLDDADENLVTANYSDIIYQATIVKYLMWYGGFDLVGNENQILMQKISAQRKKEARDGNSGRPIRLANINR